MPDDQQKIELEKREQVKRRLVENEFAGNPLFLAMKRSAKEANIPFDIETFVDKYFEYSPDSANNFQNQDFYKVDSELITYVLNQTIYLISVTENGVILNPDGTIDREGSEMQAKVMAGTATQEEKQELYNKLMGMNNDKADNTIETSLVEIKLSRFLDDLYGKTDEEFAAMFKDKEFKKTMEDYSDGFTKMIIEAKLATNIQNEDELQIIMDCWVVSSIFEQEKMQDTDPKELSNIIGRLKQLAEKGNEWAQEIVGKEGDSPEIIFARAIEQTEDFFRDEQAGRSLQVLQEAFGSKKDFLHFYDSQVSDERKEQLLEAAMILYSQSRAEYKEIAMNAFKLLKLTTMDSNGELIPDKGKVADVYLGITGEDKSYLDILRGARSKIDERTNDTLYELEAKSELGQFQARSDEECAQVVIQQNEERKAEYERENENENERNVETVETSNSVRKKKEEKSTSETKEKSETVGKHNRRLSTKKYVIQRDNTIARKLDKMLEDLDYESKISMLALARDYVKRQYEPDSDEVKNVVGYIQRHKRQFQGIDEISIEEHEKRLAKNPSLYRAVDKMKADRRNPQETEADLIGRNISQIISKESDRKLGLFTAGIVGTVKDFIDFQKMWLDTRINVGETKLLDAPSKQKAPSRQEMTTKGKEQDGFGEADYEDELARRIANLKLKSAAVIASMDMDQLDSGEKSEEELYNFYLKIFNGDEEKAMQSTMKYLENRERFQRVKDSGEKSLSQEAIDALIAKNKGVQDSPTKSTSGGKILSQDEIDVIVAREMAAQPDPSKSTTRTIEELEAVGDTQLSTGEIVTKELIENILDSQMGRTEDLAEKFVAPVQGIIEGSSATRENANKTTTKTATKENYKKEEIKEDKEFEGNAPTNEFDRLYKVDITPTANVGQPKESAQQFDDKAYVKAAIRIYGEQGGEDKALLAALLGEPDKESMKKIREYVENNGGIGKDDATQSKEQPVPVRSSGDER